MDNLLQQMLPWTSKPLIVNAPMGGFAGAELAVAVTKAGGLGQIGAVFAKDLEEQLAQAATSLRDDNSFQNSKTLPIGVGLLTFILKPERVLPILQKFNPHVVWLFAAKELDDYATWTTLLRETCPDSKLWIQVGSVSGAVHIAKTAKPDVMVLQGIDAGGHGFEKGASIVSLLPEASDTLKSSGFGHIPLIASGGIVDGRGIAAAYALGAQGVVLGTRFLSAEETIVKPGYRSALLNARDGGQNTVRAKVFDELSGPNMWPVAYDGRSLVTNSYNDQIKGVSIEQIRELHKDAVQGEDLGWGKTNRATVWAGTGVGLVTKVEKAENIVKGVRREARAVLDAAKSRL